jgi:putative DNA primase/helicase
VLEGPQGIKKSSAIAKLFGDQYVAESVNIFDQHNKMVMSMMGAWCVELAEFVAILNRDKNTVKGMLSMRTDRVVLPYAKVASDHPRQCIFVGTINPGDSGYLTDNTGNRRYWPVEVTKADLDLIEDRRDQIWAEAAKAYFAGEAWWIESEDEHALAVQQTESREEYDVWDEILAAKLIGYSTTTIAAALQAIGVPNERMDKKDSNRVAASLRRLGFTSKDTKERGDDGKRRTVLTFYREDG